MPELPDVAVYCEALAARVRGELLLRVQLKSPFVLRTAVPPIASAEGKRVRDVRRLGKRIVLGLDDDLFLVIHLMIAGRLRWLDAVAKPPARIALAVLEFGNGRIAFTEAGTKRRASLHLVRGADALAQFDMGGLEVGDSSLAEFAARLRKENHTLKRALTDPRLFSGIGNAYSDEILHRARLSPLALTHKLPAVTLFTDFAREGGLMAYGPNLLAFIRQQGVMAAKILQGAKPAETPIETPVKFEFVLNLKTANALGLTMPASILLRADEVIE